MNTIELTPKNFIKYKKKRNRKRFLLIGSDSVKHRRFMRKIIKPKLKKQFAPNVPGFWATLGFSDGTLKNWTGNLEVSEYGNDNIKGVGKSLTEKIKQIYGLEEGTRIIERFISFDNSEIEFPKGEFTENDIPVLRLTLMLGKHESALVFYQHKDNETGEEFPEFILAEPTEKNNLNVRDRLTYYFKALPKRSLEPVDKEKNLFRLNDNKQKRQFKIKVITFRRKEFVDSDDFLNFIKKKMYCKGENESHCLLKFSSEKNDFQTVLSNDIDPELKTLFLIHGTFASTEQSFNALYKADNEWLKQQTVAEGGKYKQIIAFDHPTVTDDAQMNTEKLFNMLGKDFRFRKDVDIIASSQGGLFAQYLANYKQEETKIPVGKVALIASANGVDYFRTAEHISKFLTVMMHVFEASGRLSAAFITGLASQSAAYFLHLPGAKMMTPGNDSLTNITGRTPSNENTCYLPIIDNFDKNSAADSGLLKIILRFISVTVFPIMGKYNDLVVRTKNQYNIHKEFCCIPAYDSENFKDQMVSSLHGKALDLDEVRAKIQAFLNEGNCTC
jgi:pimeloyl-ACP methyl ester carboxylesterase